SKKICTQSVPRFASYVNVYVEEDISEQNGSERRKSLVATVNLHKLGWSANIKRLMGGINHLYVMELPHGSHSPLAAAAA
ncbi:hypothetical protein MMC11_009045, partial [Xylographa trunciseda]|nr:hypothetical protein [Xylographa trunciseda]